MKRYGYHRTSTREQHLDRGIAEITAYCEHNQLELEKIYTDQQTGKNFNRPRYQVLKEDVLLLRPSQLDLQLIQLPVTELTDILSPKNKKERILEPLLWRAGEFQDLWWYRYHDYRIKVSVRTQ